MKNFSIEKVCAFSASPDYKIRLEARNEIIERDRVKTEMINRLTNELTAVDAMLSVAMAEKEEIQS